MATTVLRPDAASSNSVYGGAAVTAVGAASLQAAVVDNSDSSYVQQTCPSGAASSIATFTFPAPTIPAGAVITSVRPRIRTKIASVYGQNNQGFYLDNVYGFYGAKAAIAASAGFIDNNGITSTALADGSPLTAAAIDTMTLSVLNSGLNYQTLQVSEVYLDVTYDEAPVPTVTAPTGVQTTSRPIVAWSYSDPEGSAQQRFRVRTFTAAQYSAVGFDPLTSTATHDSGELTGATALYQIPVDLPNETTYRSFVQVSDNGTRWSVLTTSGPYQTFSISMPVPAVPTITSVTPNDVLSFESLLLTDGQNLLSADAASFEGAAHGWTALSNCAVLRMTPATDGVSGVPDGSYALKVTTSANGTSQAQSPLVACQPSKVYSAIAYNRSGNISAHSTRVDLKFYDASSTLITSVGGMSVTPIFATFSPDFVTATAPANAAYVAVVQTFISDVAGEYHYVDAAAIVPGAINMLVNPLFEVDSNSDGVADNWASYSFPGGDPAATYSLPTAAPYVWGGLQSQRLSWTVNNGYKGLSQGTLPIFLGKTYTASFWVRSDTPGTIGGDIYLDACTTPVSWSITGGSGWQRVTATFVATSTSNVANLYFRCTKPAATIEVGHSQLELGATASTPVLNRKPWVRGGLLTPSRFDVQRSDDGGVTWKALTRLYRSDFGATDLSGIDYSDALQNLIADDYEAPRKIAPVYRVRTKALVGGSYLVSQWSTWKTATALTATNWLLKSLTNPTLQATLRIDWGSFVEDEPIDVGSFEPIDSDETVVIQGRNRGSRLAMALRFLTEASWNAYDALRARRETLLLQDPNGRQWYVRLPSKRAAREFKYSGGITRTLETEMTEVSA